MDRSDWRRASRLGRAVILFGDRSRFKSLVQLRRPTSNWPARNLGMPAAAIFDLN